VECKIDSVAIDDELSESTPNQKRHDSKPNKADDRGERAANLPDLRCLTCTDLTSGAPGDCVCGSTAKQKSATQ